MEFILFILAVIILVLIVGIRNSVTSRFNTIQEKLDELSTELKKTRSESRIVSFLEKKTILTEEIFDKTITASQPVVEKMDKPKVPEIKKEEVKVPPETIIFPQTISAPSSHQPFKPPVVPPSAPKTPGFFERNPDLEKFIGENLANKIDAYHHRVYGDIIPGI